MTTYQIIVMDSCSGRTFITDIVKPVEGDFEEYIDNKLEALGFRMTDCDWMEFTDQEIEYL